MATYSNFARDTLSASIASTDTSIALTDASEFPASDFYLIINPQSTSREILYCSSRSTNTLTVTRGQKGTTAAAHSAGTTVIHGLLADDFLPVTGGTVSGLLNVQRDTSVLGTTNLIELKDSKTGGNQIKVQVDSSGNYFKFIPSPGGTDDATKEFLYDFVNNVWLFDTDAVQIGGSKVWHAGNDGTGSTLDADLLDGYHATSFLLLSGGSMTGALNMQDNELAGAKIKDYGETVAVNAASSTAATIDLTLGNVHDVTLTAACTFTFANPPASGTAGSFTLVLKQDATGGWAVTWPASVKWAGGTAPTLTTTASKADVLTFMTTDGGTTWLGFPAGLNF